ncbi:MAG: membrane protein [marine bacterium B5-7]|nr:MAG: membrane protein [marine bacterium B5-7]
MGGALLSFMAMAISGRELSVELETFEILVYRSIVGLIIVLVMIQRSGWGQVRTKHFGVHFIRNSFHLAGQFGWFYGIALIPLAQVFAIEFTAPIWASVLAVIILKERMTPSKLLAVALGISGMLIILRPGFETIQPAVLMVLMGALGYATSYVLTKKLTRTDTPLCILFFMSAIQLPMALIPTIGSLTVPSLHMLPWLILVGSTALSAHYCLARAFLLADATVVIPLDFLRLPLIAMVGYLVYSEPLDALLFIGALVMMTGNIINVRAASRGPRSTMPESDS